MASDAGRASVPRGERYDGGEGEPQRVLVLVRHAHAKNRSETGDHGRELSKSGRAVAQVMGAWLAREGVRADLAVCSTSTRTVQTVAELAAGGLSIGAVETQEGLYQAYVDDVVDMIREVGDHVGTLVVVGHAPAVPQLAAELADHTGLAEAELRHRLAAWSPAGIGVVVHHGPWSRFPEEGTALVAVVPPRDPM